MNKLRTGISASLAAFLFAACSASAETEPAASADASASQKQNLLPLQMLLLPRSQKTWKRKISMKPMMRALR